MSTAMKTSIPTEMLEYLRESSRFTTGSLTVQAA